MTEQSWKKTTFWTEERTETLKTMWAAGESGTDVAKVIGCSRCAVLGKAFRLKLSPRTPNSPHANKPRKPRPYKRAAWALDDVLANGKWRQPPRKRQPIPTELEPECVPNPVDIIAIRSDQCRFPVEGEGLNTLFCGAVTLDGYSYCPHHCSRAFNTMPSLTRAELETHQRKLAKNYGAAA